MLKNLSDYLSLFTLIVMNLYALRFFISSLTPPDQKDDNTLSRKQLLKDYINNTEE